MKTVSDVIDSLGGTTKAAAILGVGPSAVSNWKATGEFPARLHFVIFRECERRGIKIDLRRFEKEPVQCAS